jgi:hypothetical protein
MNTTPEDKIQSIVALLPVSAREQLASLLRKADFTDPNDPMLNVIHAQVLVGSQPLAISTAEGAKLATAEDLARLGDRYESGLWEVASLKLGNILLFVAAAVLIGSVCTLIALHFYPSTVCKVAMAPAQEVAVNIPIPVADERLQELEQIGVHLMVKRTDKGTYIYCDPKEPQPQAGSTKDGISYLYVNK